MIAQLVVALARRNHVALLYLRRAGEPPLDERVRQACDLAVETRAVGGGSLVSPARGALSAGLDALRGTPGWVVEYCSPEYAATLRSVVAAWEPHVVQAEFHLMGQYLPATGRDGLPKVLNQHEPGAAAAADRLRLRQIPGLIMPRLDVRAWRTYERKLVGAVDAVVTFTERDREDMRKLGANRVEVIRPGAEIPAEAANPLGALPPRVLFFGNYLHAPNVDAALRLALDIFPRLAAEIPGLQLVLLGDRAPEPLRALASEQVCMPGRVPDIAPWLDAAAVVVVPLRMGGGMRVKVLEALSAGKAVVASAVAVEGLDLMDGEHILRAETDDEFVGQTLRLLADPVERVRIAQQARGWALEHLSWDRAAAQYEALYNSLLAPPPGADLARGRGIDAR